MFSQVSVCPPGEVYTPWADTPQVDTPLGRHPSADTPRQTSLDRHFPLLPWQTATAADGTHSTGMHSCFEK